MPIRLWLVNKLCKCVKMVQRRQSLMICSVVNMIVYILCLFSYANGMLNLPAGAPCVNNGMQGKCVDVKLCPTVTMITIPQKKLLPEICSYNDIDPVICCTDCEIETKDARKAVITVDGYRFKTGKSKAWDECLEHLQRLDYHCKKKFEDFIIDVKPEGNCTFVDQLFKAVVVNGEDAKRREFPHMALVGFGESLESVQWLCGGSIISNRFILTAAHCAEHVQFGPASYVAMGILKRNDPMDLWDKYRVKRFISHPQYKSPIKYHDIALIETDKRIRFTKDVLPACLAEAAVEDEDAVVVGWGALGDRKENANTLQKAWVQKFSPTDCDNLYPVHRHLPDGVDRTSQFCYGDSSKNADTCGGDSGGPLQVTRVKVTSCVSFVVGVTSYGRACGFQGGAGMYTKVLPYIPWIESVVWP